MAEQDVETRSSEDSEGAQESAEAEGFDTGTALVEIEPGIAIVFGDGVPEGFDEVIPFQLLDQRSMEALSSAISVAAGFGNLAAQGFNGVMQAQGLVRLSPKTLRALQSAKPLTSGGWNLGTLMSQQGKFAHQVRWLPAGSASVASVAASLGPAIAMIAIQFQLAAVTKLVTHNVELTSKVLQTFRNERLAAVTGHQRTLAGEVENAQHIGSVTDAIWKDVRGQQRELEAQLDFFRHELEGHVETMRSKRSNKQRQEFLADHGGAIVSDAYALISAQSSWLMYQSLRASHLLGTAATNPQDETLLKKLVKDVRELNATVLTETAWLLEQINREFGIMAELDGRRTFILGGERKAGKHVVTAIRQVQDVLASIRDQVPLPELTSPTAPDITLFKNGAGPHELLRLLRFRLERGESLQAMADGAPKDWIWAAGWLVVTSHRILVLKQGDFRRFAAIDRQIPIQHVRHVNLIRRGKEDKAPWVNVVTRDGEVTFEFGDWAARGRRRQDVERFVAVIRKGSQSAVIGPGAEMIDNTKWVIDWTSKRECLEITPGDTLLTSEGEELREVTDSSAAHLVRLYLLRDRLFLMVGVPNDAVLVNGDIVRRNRELRDHDELEISGTRGTVLRGSLLQV